MKKQYIAGAAALALILGAAVFTGCKKEGVLSVGATPVPHAELLNLVKADLAAKGITLQVREFNDYVQPNEALIAGDLDANFFQHIPYLASNEKWNTNLVSAFGVHVEPFGLYSEKYKALADIPDGASIAIPNDPTNGGRALLLLQSNGLITLRDGAGVTATAQDVASNPHKFQFVELEAAQLPRSLGDVDAASINGNFALEAGFNPVRDSLIIEGADSPYVNIVVVRKGSESDSRIKALEAALRSQKVKDFINTTYNGAVLAIF